ncbi:MAG TPA: hypothetical protein VGV93_07580 [Acidimicrobiales bacterium]|nr:hypothetical protein [Acidimicrobiales bacterium]
MAIEIDLSREIRGVDQLRALVRAVLAAHPSEEASWIEWKSHINLTSKDGCMKVASAILGLANRPVDEAARTCAGFGYLVVGAEPDKLTGVVVPDPAGWVTKVEQYLKGDTAPTWAHTTIPIDGRNVLVITVDPPQHGDLIWTVRKELSGVMSGTVFVRKPGKTERATAKDMDTLQERLLARTPSLPDLVVELVGDLPLSWLPGSATLEQVAAWARTRRDSLAAAAHAAQDQQNTPSQELATGDWLDGQSMGAIQDVVRQFLPEPDQRTLEDYLAELDSWVDELDKAAQADLLRRYFEHGYGLSQVKVTNNSTQYLAGVEVSLHMDLTEIKGFEEIPGGRYLPRPPRPLGQPKPNPKFAALSRIGMPPDYDFGVAPLTAHLRDTRIEDGSIHLTVDAGELRPRRHHVGDEFHILLLQRPGSGTVPVTWSATVKDRDWIIEGAFEVPVAQEPVDVADIFNAEVDDE